MSFPYRFLAAVLLAPLSSFASGVPPQLVYQGRLLKADGKEVGPIGEETENFKATYLKD